MKWTLGIALVLLSASSLAQTGAQTRGLSLEDIRIELPADLPMVLSAKELEQRNETFSRLTREAMKYASGSDIIGNGAGIAEQNISFLFKQLDRHLATCLNKPNCLGSREERLAARKLLDLAVLKRHQENAIVFLEESDFNRVFGSSDDLEQRAAKTGFAPIFPIFVNVGALYENKLEADLGFMLALLTHELGHQLGIGSHSFLDGLAASVRNSFERFYQTYSLSTGMAQVSLAHFSSGDSFFFDYGVLRVNERSYSFSTELDGSVCAQGGSLAGMRWSNLHFARPRTNAARNELQVGARAWGEAFCQKDGVVTVEMVDLSFDFLLEASGDGEFELVDFYSRIVN